MGKQFCLPYVQVLNKEEIQEKNTGSFKLSPNVRQGTQCIVICFSFTRHDSISIFRLLCHIGQGHC